MKKGRIDRYKIINYIFILYNKFIYTLLLNIKIGEVKILYKIIFKLIGVSLVGLLSVSAMEIQDDHLNTQTIDTGVLSVEDVESKDLNTTQKDEEDERSQVLYDKYLSWNFQGISSLSSLELRINMATKNITPQ